MSKSSIRLALVLLVAAVWQSPAALQAEAVPELSASKVITLVPADSTNVPPVVSGIALDPGAKLLAAVGDDHSVRVLEADSGALLQRLAAHTDWVKTAAFRPDGGLLATAGADRRIRFWEPTKEHSVQQWPTLPAAIYTLTYSPDGKLLAAAGFSDKVWVFDAADGRPSMN